MFDIIYFVTNKNKSNLFIEIHKDFWSKFTTKFKKYANEYFNKIVQKMIECGDPNFGYTEYGCMNCGGSRHIVGFTCKTHYCLRCARVFSEKFANHLTSKLIPGMVYRHLMGSIEQTAQ
ncbi:MAG: transposase zinc-binding domain-containing protein [Oligoflexia bacterium]|nr:transposase zinc-binding domain-containing protein [Oligoflexia bacterium]